MPFKSAQRKREHDALYYQRRKEQDLEVRATVEQRILALVKAHEGVFDSPTLYYAFEGKVPFLRIQKTVLSLLGDGYKGILEQRRVGDSLRLYVREVGPVPIINITAPSTSTEQ